MPCKGHCAMRLPVLAMLLVCSVPERTVALAIRSGLSFVPSPATASSCRMLPVYAQLPAVDVAGNGEAVDVADGATRRKFELCKLDEDFNIDECEVIYDDDLVDVLGAEQAARIMSDPTALDVFFQLPIKDGESGNPLQERLASRMQSAQQNRTVFTMADWEVCLQDDLVRGVDKDLTSPLHCRLLRALCDRTKAPFTLLTGAHARNFASAQCEVPDDVLNRALGPDR